MKSFRLFDREARRIVVTAGLLVATVLPGVVPAFASAATITERSIALTSSVKATTGVGYKVKFNAQHAATGAFIVDFCTTAAIGSTCTTPTGLNITTPTTSTSGYTVSATDANTAKVVIATPVDVDDPVEVTIAGLTNPTAAGGIYARILTYADSGAAGSNDSEAATMGSPYDKGTVALTITDGFSVSGSVLESLAFCATDSASTIGSGCTGTLGLPSVVLGSNGVLTADASEGIVKTQISTNAASGAVVNLKSDTSGCGGLVRQGATSNAVGCGITPITTPGTTSIGQGLAKFGMKLGALSAGNGTVRGYGNYNVTDYYMGWASGDATGVTSPYGDTIYDTNDGPISDGTANLTFGANIGNVTPAGSYSAKLNLIATGKF